MTMNKHSDKYIEEAFAKIRTDFEQRRNKAGLEILDGFEEGWAEYGSLTDRQRAWLEKQLDGSWRQAAEPCAAEDRGGGEGAKPRRSMGETEPGVQEVSDAAIRRRLRQQGKAAVELGRLAELEAAVDELKRAIQLLS